MDLFPSSRSKNKIIFDSEEHYINCKILYLLINELQKKIDLDRSQLTKLYIYVQKVGEGCKVYLKKPNKNRKRMVKKLEKSKDGSSNKNARNHDRRVMTFQEAYEECLMFQMKLHIYESRMINLLDRLDNTNKANSLHVLKRWTNDIRNPCDRYNELFPELWRLNI
jgi:hypothetical protein